MGKTESFLLKWVWTQRRKIYLIWTPRRNLSAEIDSPWSTKSLNLINMSLRAICWQGFLSYSVHREEPQTELSASWLCLFMLSQPLQGSPGFVFQPMDWNLPCPVRTAQLYPYLHLYQPIKTVLQWSIKTHNTNQSELHNSDHSELYEFRNSSCIKLGHLGTFSINRGLPFGERVLSVSTGACVSLVCKWFHLNKVSPFLDIFVDIGNIAKMFSPLHSY